MKTRTIAVIEMAFEVVSNEYRAGWILTGNIFKYLEGYYIATKVDELENRVIALRLDIYESIETELPCDATVTKLRRIESL